MQINAIEKQAKRLEQNTSQKTQKANKRIFLKKVGLTSAQGKCTLKYHNNNNTNKRAYYIADYFSARTIATLNSHNRPM